MLAEHVTLIPRPPIMFPLEDVTPALPPLIGYFGTLHLPYCGMHGVPITLDSLRDYHKELELTPSSNSHCAL